MEANKFKNYYFNLNRSRFASALWLNKVFPKKIRRGIAKFFDIITVFSLIFYFALYFSSFIRSIQMYDTALIKEKIIDFIFLVLTFRLIIFALENFYRSESVKKIGKESSNIADYFDFETASLFSKTIIRHKFISGANILETFTGTDAGKFVFLHLGISYKDFRSALPRLLTASAPEEGPPLFLGKIFDRAKSAGKNEIDITDAFMAVMENEEAIFQFFFEREIKKEDIEGVSKWASLLFKKRERASAWWLEENLNRVPGIAKDWAYGATYLLDRYSRVFREHHPVGEHQILHFTGHQKQIEAIEAILSRTAQANVLIVGEPGVGKRTAIAGFDNLIKMGKIRPELEFKRILELNAGSLVSAAKTKGDLESLILRLFQDAVSAGNIILVIDNFAEFLKSAEALGVSLMQVIGPYLGSSDLQVIAISDSGGFKRFLEPDSSLMQYFEIVRVEEPDNDELIQILEDVSLEIKQMVGVIILFQSIREAVRASGVYMTEGALPERAIDILETVSSRVSGLAERKVVLPQDISSFISEKTKMPLGVLKQEEREKLLRLEEVLHQRVVDQEEAISAIAAAVRRIRVGMQETKKPLSSFLFLGPTGVGKTETAKALSAIYFGDEDAMTRFDMSEYQNEGGLERLIGSFEKNEPGLLATKLREKPYGLLLLDEFEKCHQKVMDLFLQILDEGFFTDAFGKKVFVRNNIIIATSNAASQLIWEMVKSGIDPSAAKETVIESIQKQGIFKAELLNRFDAIIVFHPLSREHLQTIARLMLEKLKKRIFEQKEIELVINDILLEKVAEIGYDPVFGARPMQRAIQERIEKKIAEWIIEGKVNRGAKIEFTTEDLASI